jgi:hypothetical protein
MAELEISLHPAQLRVWQSPARFKVVAAGRRFGKTFLGCRVATVAALSDTSYSGYPVGVTHEVGYIFPTFEQAKRVVWPKFKEFLAPLEPNAQQGTVRMFENTGVIEFSNGAKIRLLGADNPDSIRGLGFRKAILDEYKDMDPTVWEEIIRPALMDVGGDALFIGTPKGKNHFYELFKRAEADKTGVWEAFSFTSAANTALPEGELAETMRDMSSILIKQEIEASFVSETGAVFKDIDWFPISREEPADGEWIVTADLAGFATTSSGVKQLEKKDESAIAIVKAHKKGWWVKEIIHGRWDVRETALRLFQACRSVQCSRLGIEKGMAANAVLPYLTDLMRQYSRWIDVVPLTHGNQRKYDRIQWALQGRAEKREIVLNPDGYRHPETGPWHRRFLDQALDFPEPRSHDDLVDALAYVDQMATTTYIDDSAFETEFVPVDQLVGY